MRQTIRPTTNGFSGFGSFLFRKWFSGAAKSCRPPPSGVSITKALTSSKTKRPKHQNCCPGMTVHPSLIFEGMARSFPWRGAPVRCSTGVRSGHTRRYLPSSKERLAENNHSGIICSHYQRQRKKFITFSTPSRK